jgi:ionotropic glutamate receptor
VSCVLDEQAFPKGSPYVADLSRAILNLTESDEMSAIERKWFGDAEGCAAQGSPFTSDSLSFASFWGLFLVTGATSLLCCAVHLATFLVANRRRIRVVASTSDVHWKDRLRMFLQLFDDKDLSSHTFRTKDGGGSVAGRSANDAGASPAVAHIAASSPLSASNHTYDMSEWSLHTPSPAPEAAGEIELAAGGEAEEEVASAPNPNVSSDQNGTGHQASN